MKKDKIIIFAIINIVLIFIIILFLPNKVPIHIGSGMKIDKYGSKWHLIFLASLPILINLFSKVSEGARGVSNELNVKLRRNVALFSEILPIILCWIFVFASFNENTMKSGIISPLLVFILTFSIGLFLSIFSLLISKVGRSFIIGIRLPRVVRSDKILLKTNKLASIFGISGGFSTCALAVIGYVAKSNFLSSIGIINGIIFAFLLPLLYSILTFN